MTDPYRGQYPHPHPDPFPPEQTLHQQYTPYAYNQQPYDPVNYQIPQGPPIHGPYNTQPSPYGYTDQTYVTYHDDNQTTPTIVDPNLERLEYAPSRPPQGVVSSEPATHHSRRNTPQPERRADYQRIGPAPPPDNEAETYKVKYKYEPERSSCNCCCYNPAMTFCSCFCMAISIAFVVAGVALIISAKVIQGKCDDKCGQIPEELQGTDASSACGTVCKKIVHDAMFYSGVIITALSGLAVVWRLMTWTCAGCSK